MVAACDVFHLKNPLDLYMYPGIGLVVSQGILSKDIRLMGMYIPQAMSDC